MSNGMRENGVILLNRLDDVNLLDFFLIERLLFELSFPLPSVPLSRIHLDFLQEKKWLPTLLSTLLLPQVISFSPQSRLAKATLVRVVVQKWPFRRSQKYPRQDL
jgi:hypothetical protein